jgi:hypothetical protein
MIRGSSSSLSRFFPFNATMSVFRRFLVTANPGSYNYSAIKLASVAYSLRQFGAFVEIAEATSSREICAAARATEAQAIIVAGGDGSINAAIEGLLCRPRPGPSWGSFVSGTTSPPRVQGPDERDFSRRIYLGLQIPWIRAGMTPTHIGASR